MPAPRVTVSAGIGLPASAEDAAFGKFFKEEGMVKYLCSRVAAGRGVKAQDPRLIETLYPFVAWYLPKSRRRLLTMNPDHESSLAVTLAEPFDDTEMKSTRI